MSLTKGEMETIIRRTLEDVEWDVFTDDPVLRRRLARLGYSPTQEGPGFFLVPLSAVRIRSFHHKTRVMSAEQREAASRRMRELQARQKVRVAALRASRVPSTQKEALSGSGGEDLGAREGVLPLPASEGS